MNKINKNDLVYIVVDEDEVTKSFWLRRIKGKILKVKRQIGFNFYEVYEYGQEIYINEKYLFKVG